MKRSLNRTALLTVLAPISWGTTYITVTELLPADRPMLVAAFRVLPAGLILVVAGRLIGTPWRPHGHDWTRLAVLSLCNFALFFPLLIGAVYRLPGGVAAAVGGIQPLLVAALSWLVLGRRPSRLEVLTGVAAVVGVSLVVVRPGAGLDPVGVLLGIGANVSFAMGVVLTKRFAVPGNRLTATGLQLLIAGAVLAPAAFVTEGAVPPLSTVNVAGFAYLSVVTTAVAFLIWFNGVQRLPTAAPPLLGLGSPVTGAVLGWLVLGQHLSSTQLLGFLITIGAIGRGATLRPTGIAASAGTLGRHEHHVARAPASCRDLRGDGTGRTDAVRGMDDAGLARAPAGA